jgi:hypothetical protein
MTPIHWLTKEARKAIQRVANLQWCRCLARGGVAKQRLKNLPHRGEFHSANFVFCPNKTVLHRNRLGLNLASEKKHAVH